MKTFTNAKHPIKAWVDGVEFEPAAKQQVENMASLPFIHSHVAVMPDVHVGIGATVGSVIPTVGAIVPAAVGVDIGCFAGETEVVLADSRSYRIDDLARLGSSFVVYACTPSGRIHGAWATAKRTRVNAALVAVTLDNGRVIRCTPDHEFMMRDGTYRRAAALTCDQSLMPFEANLDDEGYLRVFQPNSAKPQRAHWLMARSGLLGKVLSFAGQRTVIHHKNFDESDNTPENLIFMGAKDHASYHRQLVERNTSWQSAAFETARKAALRMKAQTPEGRKYFAARGTANILAYMRDRRDEFLKAVSLNGARGAQYLVAYNRSEAGRAKSQEIGLRFGKRNLTCPECSRSLGSTVGLYRHRLSKHGVAANHRVRSVELLAEREDVYCLTVPEFGNFALSAGIFVHNCGMVAQRLTLRQEDLPDNLAPIRDAIERTIPVGFAMHKSVPDEVATAWAPLEATYQKIMSKYPKIDNRKATQQLGTMGGGNHFCEVTIDTEGFVWLVLHSGSRGIGNRIGTFFIERAKREMEKAGMNLVDRDLAYLTENTESFDDYVEAVEWAQTYARTNRDVMVARTLNGLRDEKLGLPAFALKETAVNCHHNYVAREHHFGADVYVTRKGAVRAGAGELGIIPGSMGARSFIVRGKGNPESFESCSHGAGRRMGRKEATRRLTLADLERETAGVECRKDAGVLDEAPSAYKSIEAVMAAQSDLVEIVHEFRQVVCVKG